MARETARSYRLSRWEQIRYVIWPTTLPYLMTGVRLAAAVALDSHHHRGAGDRNARPRQGAFRGPDQRRLRDHVCLCGRHRNHRRGRQCACACARARGHALAFLLARGSLVMNTDRAMQIVRQTAMAMGLPALLFAAWWISSSGSESIFFPPLSKILRVFAEVWFSPRISHDVVPSMVRFFIGYLSAVALGLVLGIPIGASRRMRQVLEPVSRILARDPSAGAGADFHAVCRHRRHDEDAGDRLRLRLAGAAQYGRRRARPGQRAGGGHLLLSHRHGRPALAFRAAGRKSADLCRHAAGAVDRHHSHGHQRDVRRQQRTRLRAGAVPARLRHPEMWTGIILLGLIGILLAFIFRLVENWLLAWYFGFRRSQRESS